MTRNNKGSLLNVIVLAAAGATTSWLIRHWLDNRYKYRTTRAKRELKEQIKTWEDEGGALAPPVEPRDLATH